MHTDPRVAKLLTLNERTSQHQILEMPELTKNPAANALIRNLSDYPHAFVFACLMDRRIKAERAWSVPFELSSRLGGFHFSKLKSLTLSDLTLYMSKPYPLHSWPDKMADVLHRAISRIQSEYKGDASNIWSGRPSSAEVVYRFLQFDGAGNKIATMATNILARRFSVEFSDHASIDISVDTHVKRVMYRLGFCSQNATIEQIIYKARALNPTYPGIIDFPCWNLGKTWCHSTSPDCKNCPIHLECPSALQHS